VDRSREEGLGKRERGSGHIFAFFVFAVVAGFILALCIARLSDLERRVGELEKKVGGSEGREK